MIDYSKIIIVTGMPRAGTSIITRVLASHPEITLFADGSEIHVLENHLLPLWTDSNQDIETLEAIQSKCETEYLVMKRPDLFKKDEENNFSERFKDSLFIVMRRGFKKLKKSWNMSGMVPKKMALNAKNIYKESNKEIKKFIQEESDRRILYSLEQLQQNPKELFSIVSSKLEIENLFSTASINNKGKWDHSKYLRELFLKRKAITNLSTNKESTLRGIGKKMTEEEIDSIITI